MNMKNTSINRRTFLQTTSAALLGMASFAIAAEEKDERYEAYVPCRAITREPGSHWFSYYDKFQFDPTNRYVLGMRVEFNDRSPKPDDIIHLGYIDLENDDQWVEFDETTAWNWQQGCMLQWLPGSSSEVIFNVREEGFYASKIMDVFTRQERYLPQAIYAVGPKGREAVVPNFARLNDTRPGYGYAGIPDPFANRNHPIKDGIHYVDLRTGLSRMILSLDQMLAFEPQENMKGENIKHWFNHLLISPDGRRFIFLHRWNREDGRSWHTRMITADITGKNLHIVADHDMVSHFIWKNDKQIIAWSREPETGDHFHLYTDQSNTVEVIGDGILTRDGHCTYSPDGKWILTDTYPDANRMQNLMLYHPEDNELIPLGKFYLSPDFKGETRCDLHPRWSRDGKMVCIDSLHSGKRQMYLLDVSKYTA
ncbi:MAG: hypothetical protein ACOX5R_01080 [bacterium]|jgi:hypothetical protein